MPVKPNQNIILFAGAGMVKPLGLPTVVEFENMISQSMNKEEMDFINKIKNYVKSQKLNDSDIEYIFNSINKFLQENPEVTIFLINREVNPDIPSIFRNFVKNAKTSFEKLKKIFYNSLNEFDIGKARLFYVSLFRKIKEIFNTSNISFITTNYDTTFDEVVKKFRADFTSSGYNTIDFLFRPYHNIAFTYQPSNNNFPKQSIEYIKLHGSINWFIDKEGVTHRTYETITPENTSKSALIYPGFKGIPYTEPFKSLHQKFIKRLNEADFMISIGFAFRDEAINSAIESILQRKPAFKIYHINPLSSEKYPPESKVPYFLESYPQRFVHIPEEVSPENLEGLLKKVLNLHQSQH